MATHNQLLFRVNLPGALGEQIECIARVENITADQFVEDAVKRQSILKRHQALQKFGQANAKESAFTESDLPRLVAESRGESREH